MEETAAARRSGADKGELQVTEDWTTPDGKTLLREDTTYVFRGGPGLRAIGMAIDCPLPPVLDITP